MKVYRLASSKPSYWPVYFCSTNGKLGKDMISRQPFSLVELRAASRFCLIAWFAFSAKFNHLLHLNGQSPFVQLGIG